jgi:predicted PolB exonuclease-like 3'-5' exonuclease
MEELTERFPGKRPFIPVSFHVPVAVAVARVDSSYRLLDIGSLDAPRFDSRTMVDLFWRGVEFYRNAALVDFNGRGFDLPLLSFSAFRFGLACPRYSPKSTLTSWSGSLSTVP